MALCGTGAVRGPFFFKIVFFAMRIILVLTLVALATAAPAVDFCNASAQAFGHTCSASAAGYNVTCCCSGQCTEDTCVRRRVPSRRPIL